MAAYSLQLVFACLLLSAQAARPAGLRGNPHVLLAASRGDIFGATGGEPQSLAEYCKGGPAPIQDEQVVEADWGDYGSWYPAKIVDVNKNNTVDIKYDDGWTEKRVNQDNVKPVDGKTTKGEADKPDDAACQVVEKLEDVKKRVKEAEKDVSLWVKSKQAKEHGVEPGGLPAPTGKTLVSSAAPAPAASAPAAAPAAMPPATAKQSDELQRLKEELSGIDGEILDLSKEIAANDELIYGNLAEDDKLGDGVLTIDDLINQYKDRIAQRKKDLAELKARRRRQDEQLARVGVSPVSLSNIQEDVKGITDDVEGLKQTRDKLKGEGNLDPELGHALDKLIDRGDRLAARVKDLSKAEGEAAELKAQALSARQKAKEEAEKLKAEARRAKEKAEAAARRTKEKAREVREKAEAQAKAAVEAAEARAKELEKATKAAADAQKKAAEDAERQVMAAAMAVQDGLNGVTDGTRGLDINVHPHGDKWWRYRYEHSFVEGLLACWVTVFVFFWEWVLKQLRMWVFKHSHLQLQQALSYGTLYLDWLECFLRELVACLLTFLTVWVLGHFYIFDAFPRYLPSTKHLHLPKTGEEYRALATEMVIIVTFAMLFYFSLLLAVVHSATLKLFRWAKHDFRGETDILQAQTTASEFGRSHTLAGTTNEYKELRRFFMMTILAQDPEAIDSATFSFWKYLRAHVRTTCGTLMYFGPLMWIPILLTFAIFVVLHGWAHMGYIRIMVFFFFVLMVNIGFMTWVITAVNKENDAAVHSAGGSGAKTPMLAKSARFSLWAMGFALFFLCYGAARTFCQPWLWELYFNTLLCLTLATIVICAVFVIWLAPLVPTFTASLALPPYTEAAHVKDMKEALDRDVMTAKEFVEN
eukprot:CAMPEP_0172812424 /NCGR_PEP_ID=MMETSP1075-20121228/10031_1 /TAXON_ID=2916 /ORGANISM="Ceratium fusus, Strain PA161109" /LENGTH=870 /DNA_ID=CAMNT_0013651985 /DNA_START=95 /DNA_END=2707 /DNA_ORIENTATION=+